MKRKQHRSILQASGRAVLITSVLLVRFTEIVRLDVKKPALSKVMSPEEMDKIYCDAGVVAVCNEVELYRGADPIVTDLYPEDVALDKHVLLIYTDDTLDEYLQHEL